MPTYANVIQDAVTQVYRHNRPSDQRWFDALAKLPPDRLLAPAFLGKLYNFTQAVNYALYLQTMRLPQLTASVPHWQHVAMINYHTKNFVQLDYAFRNRGATGMIEPDDFDTAASLRRRSLIDLPLYLALVELCGTFDDSLGAWPLSEMMMAGSVAALQTVLQLRDKRPEEYQLLAKDISEQVIALVQNVVETLPSDGPVVRGVAAAIKPWQTIWKLQHELIEQHKG